jgi:hypothetical protein
MMDEDNAETAQMESEAFGDGCMSFVWDPENGLAELFIKALNFRRSPWDVYFLYASGVKWEGDVPPQPTFWMHQLSQDCGVDPKFLLNPGRLAKKVHQLLGREEEPDNPNLPLDLHYKALLWVTKDRSLYSVDEIKSAG